MSVQWKLLIEPQTPCPLARGRYCGSVQKSENGLPGRRAESTTSSLRGFHKTIAPAERKPVCKGERLATAVAFKNSRAVCGNVGNLKKPANGVCGNGANSFSKKSVPDRRARKNVNPFA